MLPTMCCTCFLSAPPLPTRPSFTSLAAYSLTGRSRATQAAIAAPRACPSFSALIALLDRNTCSTATSSEADLTSQCPADNTQAFPKARFVTNLALGSGAFYQWLYKPYRAGKFEKGANGRTMTIVKGVAAGAFAAKQLKDATANVKADPTLCKVFITPLTKLSNTLDGLRGKITSGDLGAIAGAGTAMDQLLSTAKSNGLNVTPQENVKL